MPPQSRKNKISTSINAIRKANLEYIKEGQKHFEEFSKYFEREDRFEKLMIAYELLDSYLGLAEPDDFLLDLYDTNIKFRVIFDKLYTFHRGIYKRLVNHKLNLLMRFPYEVMIYKTDNSYALSLLDNYKIIYGSPLHKEVFANNLSEIFTEEEIKQWLE